MKNLLILFTCVLNSIYAFSQIPIWFEQIGNGNNVQIQDLTLDSKGNIYCSGMFWGQFSTNVGINQSSGGSDVFVLKINTNGKLLWVKTFGGSLDDGGIALCTDINDNVLVTGFSNGFILGNDTINDNGFVVSYDRLGTVNWIRGLGTNSANGFDIVSFDSRTFILGEYQNQLILSQDTLNSYGWIDLFIAEIGQTGNIISGSGIGSSDREYAFSISKCGADNILVSGGNQLSGGISYGTDLATSGGKFIARYNINSKHWLAAKTIASAQGGGLFVQADDQKNIYTSGGFTSVGVFDTIQLQGNLSVNNLFIAKFDSSLNVYWAKQANSNNNLYTTGIELSKKGVSTISGVFGTQSIFGVDTLNNIGPNGIEDLFVATIDKDGRWLSANRYGGSYNEAPHGFKTNEIGTVVLSGLFVNDIAFGALSGFSSSASGDIYVAKIASIPDSSLRRIEGSVVWDKNTDCLSDSADYFYPSAIVKAMPGPFYGISNQNGNYQIYVDSTQYTVEQVSLGNQWVQSCQLNYNVTFSAYDNVRRNNNFFNYTSSSSCAIPWVDVVPVSNLRRCTSTNYKVTYCNKGNQTLVGSFIELSTPNGLTIISSNLPYISIDLNKYRFSTGDLAAGECSSFDVLIRIDCSLALGEVKCVNAKLLPDVQCNQNDTSYFQRQLTLTGNCYSSDSVIFVIKNTNTSPYSQSLLYRIFVDDSLAVTEQLNLQTGDSAIIYYPSINSTLRIQVQYLTYSKIGYQLTLSDCGSIFSSTALSEFDQNLNEESTCNQITGSFDPNDKAVIPTGIMSAHYVPRNEELEYTIRFQNTGTDTAFTVLIYDTLSSDLNLESLQIMSSSHSGVISILDGSLLKWTFQNILLPDSNVDETNSHGFVKFKISPKDSLPDFTIVNNSAAIIFDYNDPIITNSVFVTLHDTTFTCNLPVAQFSTVIQDTLVQFTNTSANSIYQIWEFGDGFSDTSFSPFHLYNLGVYQPCLNSFNNCGLDTSCDFLSLSTIFVNKVLSEEIVVFPNPAIDKVFISGKFSGKNYILNITDPIGVVHANIKLDEDVYSLEIDGHFSQGFYILRVLDKKGRTMGIKKIVVQ